MNAKTTKYYEECLINDNLTLDGLKHMYHNLRIISDQDLIDY